MFAFQLRVQIPDKWPVFRKWPDDTYKALEEMYPQVKFKFEKGGVDYLQSDLPSLIPDEA